MNRTERIHTRKKIKDLFKSNYFFTQVVLIAFTIVTVLVFLLLPMVSFTVDANGPYQQTYYITGFSIVFGNYGELDSVIKFSFLNFIIIVFYVTVIVLSFFRSKLILFINSIIAILNFIYVLFANNMVIFDKIYSFKIYKITPLVFVCIGNAYIVYCVVKLLLIKSNVITDTVPFNNFKKENIKNIIHFSDNKKPKKENKTKEKSKKEIISKNTNTSSNNNEKSKK